MNTQAIPTANILAPSAPAPSSANANDASFNQVFQREISEKRAADSASKAESKPSADASGQAAQAKAKNEARKTESSSADKGSETGASEESEQLSDAAHASAELLALVANMAHIATPAADASAKASDAELAAQIDPDTASGRGKKAALDIDALADKLQSGENAQETDSKTDGKRALQSDFASMARDMGKDAGTIERSAQLAALQNAKPVTTDGLASLSDTANVAPNAAAMTMQLNKAQAATTHAAGALTPPVGTQAWDQAVGQKVVWMVAGAQQSASLTLNPPDLGPMQIVLSVSNSQANATFVAAQPEVRQALEAALPKLREMLGEAGIQLGQANISAGTPQHGNGSEQHGKTSSRNIAQNETTDPTIPAQRQTVIRQGLGMVDTFA
jgi:flagellar hook-length control protein FliK